MAFFLMLPLAVFGLIAVLTLAVELVVEINERRRVVFKSMRRIFRPVVIEGGKSKIAPTDPPQNAADDDNAETARIKLVR